MICLSKPTWMISKCFLKFKNSLHLSTFFEYCPGCASNMAAVPHGAFAAKKVRQNEDKRKEFYRTMELNPMNYNSKYMNSIWGQYNRYSVHNLKKIMDSNVFAMGAGQEKKPVTAPLSVEKPISTDLGSVGSTISFSPNNIYN